MIKKLMALFFSKKYFSVSMVYDFSALRLLSISYVDTFNLLLVRASLIIFNLWSADVKFLSVTDIPVGMKRN